MKKVLNTKGSNNNKLLKESTKKLLLTQEQFEHLCEMRVDVTAQDNTPSGFANALDAAKQQLNAAAGATSDDIEAVVSGPKQNENLPPAVATVQSGEDPKKAIMQQDPSYISQGGSVLVQGAGFGGSRSTNESCQRFTKKMLEVTRMENFRKNGTHYTKKQLNEMMNPSIPTREEVVDFCLNNDFLYIIDFLGKQKVCAANNKELQISIANDVENSPIFEPTNEMDDIIDNKVHREFDDVTVFKIRDIIDKAIYYVVYEKEKQ